MPAGPLMSKPTWPNTKRVFGHVFFFGPTTGAGHGDSVSLSVVPSVIALLVDVNSLTFQSGFYARRSAHVSIPVSFPRIALQEHTPVPSTPREPSADPS